MTQYALEIAVGLLVTIGIGIVVRIFGKLDQYETRISAVEKQVAVILGTISNQYEEILKYVKNRSSDDR